MEQITINFAASPVDAYETAREYVQSLTHQQGRPQKSIASDMDLSPSHLSRKLSQSPDDSMRFTLDDLERWMDVNDDFRPLYFLLQKHALKSKKIEDLEAELLRVTGQIKKLKV